MRKSLGILGGMGPQATVDLFQKIIDLTQTATDAGHMRIYVDNHPQIPDRIAAIMEGKGDVATAMIESRRKLEGCGANVIIVPCVTAHYFLPQVREGAVARVLDMLELIVQACQSRYAGRRAGVLSSTATAKSGLVTDRLAAAGIDFISPSQAHQQEIAQLILQVKAKRTNETLRPFADILNELYGRGADFFILACTELPIIAQELGPVYPFLDATEELAVAAIEACGYTLHKTSYQKSSPKLKKTK